MEHSELREEFKWSQNYDKDNNRLKKTKFRLLKNLSNGHIINILIYFSKGLHIELVNKDNFLIEDNPISHGFSDLMIKSWLSTHLIFLNELKYRHDNKIFIEDYK